MKKEKSRKKEILVCVQKRDIYGSILCMCVTVGARCCGRRKKPSCSINNTFLHTKNNNIRVVCCIAPVYTQPNSHDSVKKPAICKG